MTERKKDGTYPYRPANGTEGDFFMERFCYRCKRDEKFQKTMDAEDGCTIIAASMMFEPKESGYPKEWIADDACGLENPRCTALEKIEG